MESSDQLGIKKNFTAIALFVVAVLLIIDIVLRIKPEALRPGLTGSDGSISAVGHHYQFENGSSYYIYTIFESSGDAYQCWYDGKQWNQKKVTNYKGPTIPEEK